MSGFPGTRQTSRSPSRETYERPTAVDPNTGEMVDIDTANRRLMQLDAELKKLSDPLAATVKELTTVSIQYRLRFSASVLASKERSEDRRKAEAELLLAKTTLDDSHVDLLTRKETLEMQAKSLREAGHNLRSQISGLQSVASNLRAEMRLLGLQT